MDPKEAVLSVKIPASMLAYVKIEAVQEDCSLKDLITNILQRHVKRNVERNLKDGVKEKRPV